MRRMILPLLLACLSFMAPSVFAADPAPSAVDRIFSAWDKPDTPGLALAVVRDGKIVSALPFARALYTVGRWIAPLLSSSGAMFVRLEGLDEEGKPQTMTWRLLAHDNHGPDIPCAPSIALTNKIAAGNGPAAGATPCLGLLTVEEILEPLKQLSIREFPA